MKTMLLFLALAFPALAQAAIVYDNSLVTTASSVTFNNTGTSNTNLLVFVQHATASTSYTVTFNGQALSLVLTNGNYGGGCNFLDGWILSGAPSGSSTVQVSPGASGITVQQVYIAAYDNCISTTGPNTGADSSTCSQSYADPWAWVNGTSSAGRVLVGVSVDYGVNSGGPWTVTHFTQRKSSATTSTGGFVLGEDTVSTAPTFSLAQGSYNFDADDIYIELEPFVPTLTNTPTISPTFTYSPTKTSSFTFSPTATKTSTITSTFTFSPTATRTATSSATPSNTPNYTHTWTPTVTNTPTAGDVQALFGFNTGSTYTDSGPYHYAAGPAGGGPISLTQSPHPIEGSACVASFSEANYITITTTALQYMGTQGTFVIHFYFGNGDSYGSAGGSVVLAANTAANGNFFLLIQAAGNCFVRMPETGGDQQSAFTFNFLAGRWYDILVSWTSTDYRVDWAEDQPIRVWTNALNVSSPTNPPNFGGASAFYVGKDTVAANYYTPFKLDALALYATQHTTDPLNFTYTNPDRIMWIGDSYAQGTLGTSGMCGATSNADGYRFEFDQDRILLARPYIFVGGTAQTGQVYTNNNDPFTAGVAGSTMATVLSTLNTNLSTYMPNPTSNDYVYLAFDDINDCYNAVALSTFRTQTDALANSVYAYSPNVNLIYGIRDANPSYCANDAQYQTQELNSYSAMKAAGHNVFLNNLNYLTTTAQYCSDGLHPELGATGYNVLGDQLFFGADGIMTSPTSTVTPTPTITPTATMTVDFTPTVTPTFACPIMGNTQAAGNDSAGAGVVIFKPIALTATVLVDVNVSAFVASGYGRMQAALYSSVVVNGATVPNALLNTSPIVYASASTWVTADIGTTFVTTGNYFLALEITNTGAIQYSTVGSDLYGYQPFGIWPVPAFYQNTLGNAAIYATACGY